MGWEAVMGALPYPVYVFDREGGLRYHNGRAPPGCGTLPPSLEIEKRVAAVADEDREDVFRYKPADGRERVVAVRMCPRGDRVVCTLEDRTREHEAEAALVRSSRLATIGRLAASVAHDVNNMLTVIAGHGQLLKRRVEGDESLEEIRRASARTAEITRRLGAFTRPTSSRRTWVDLGPLAADMARLLRRLLAGHGDVRFAGAADPVPVRVDPAQVEQIVLNLAVEARDVTAPGGEIVLGVRAQGCEAVLAVETDARARPRPAAGLGLEAVLGLARENGGTVFVREAGARLVFELRLPLEAAADEAATAPPRVRGGNETVMVVDDEEMVRTFCGRVLRLNGYNVLEAGRPRDALATGENYAGKIDMLLTDLVMPEMGGRELAERLAPLRPDLKVLYVSGHPGEIELRRGDPVLSKPFGPDTLANAVREILDRAPA